MTPHFPLRRLATTAMALMACCATLYAQTNLYVSPDGKPRGRGTLKSPYSSLRQAYAAARQSGGDVTIYLRGGHYTLDTTLVITPDGTPGHHSLTISSYPGEKATLSGGHRLRTAWQPYERGIMMTHIDGTPVMDMLIVNGESRPMARYPNYDSTAVRFNGTSAAATAPERTRRWQHPETGYLHAMHASDWGDFHYRITGRNADGSLRLEGGWQNNRPAPLHAQNRMVENIFEELDAPGEWFYDQATATLYYYPLPGEDIATATFETPQLRHLIELRGSAQQPVRRVTLRDLALTLTVRTFMEHYEPLLRSDWTVYRGGAVVMEGTEDCHVSDCDLYNLGGNAVFFSNYNRGSGIGGCHIRQIGASAVCFVGNPKAVRSPSFQYGQSVAEADIDRTPGPIGNDFPEDCYAEDNLIHHIGRTEKQVTGVELSMCHAITVGHNTIYHTPRAGINVSEGTWGGHVIEYNDVFETVMETGDHGAFNSWGRDRFWNPDRRKMDDLAAREPALILADAVDCTVLRHNRFRCDRGWDIDLDDGSTNYYIYGNLCLSGGLKLREGFYRHVENNILVNNTFHPHVWFANSGDVFTHNIVMTPYRPIGISHWGTELDYNIFTDSTALSTVRQAGTDAHSIVCAANFVNPQAGDYRLADVTAAARCGFRNFSQTDFGVRPERLRRLAAQPVFSTPISSTRTSTGTQARWAGLTIKTLEGLGERSATGMDSERGVYIVGVDPLDSPLRDLLRPGDVILKVGDRATDNLDGFKAAIKEGVGGGDQTFTIFRNQSTMTVSVPRAVVTANATVK